MNISKWYNWRTIVGVVLVLFGILALGQSLGYLPGGNRLVSLLFAVAFAGGGVAFLSVLFQDRRRWWAVIPGLALISIGALIAFSALFPDASDKFGGPIFLGGLSLAFWLVYFLDRDNWWAVIPGGVLLTLAVVSGMSNVNGDLGGGIFFLGLAVTFGVVALLPNGGRRMSWAWIPAGILFVMGASIALSVGGLANIVWPVALILIGAFLVFRAYRR